MNPSDLAAKLTASLNADLAAWRLHLDERDMGGIAISGQPFVVYCSGGLALRLEGNMAIPVDCKPGLIGVSHFDRATASRVAEMRGDGYKVLLARDVAHRRIGELMDAIATLSAALAA